MDSATGTIVGAIVGAFAGIAGGFFSSRYQLQLDRERWPRLREDAISQELRASIQTLAEKLASALHSMAWLTWLADRDWQAVTNARIDAYDNEMHTLFPEMMGRLAAVAALDKQSFDELNQRYQEVVTLDRKVGDAGLKFKKSPEVGGPELGSLHSQIVATANALPKLIADLVSDRMNDRASSLSR